MTSRTLADLLEASSGRFPANCAVVDSHGSVLTYAELHERSDALARFLVHRGVAPGDRVAVATSKDVNAVVSVFGIMRAGAAYVPVDASGPIDRGRRILEDCDVRAAIVNNRGATMLPAKTPAVVVGVDDFEQAINDGRAQPPLGSIVSELAYIIFTSGSTGTPKGAMITHANALAFLDWCSAEYAPTERDRFGNHAPLHFDPSVVDIYLSIKHGAGIYLVSDELGKRPRELAAFIAANRLTFWSSTPSVLNMLVRFGELESHDFGCLRIVTFGGEVFPPRQLRALKKHWSSPRYYNMYGPTETTTACTYGRIPDEVPEHRTTPYPIGFPCGHCRAAVFDADGRTVADGEEGLLHISGASVFAGYWNRPAETAAAIVERDGMRWYNTGDIVRWDPDEGFAYLGRRDGMVKRKGFRIELAEIERALHLHPTVYEAAVIAASDADGGVKIVAFLGCTGSAPSAIELKTLCARSLPAYMAPDVFITVDRLPRTSTDKVDVQALKSQVHAHTP
jgi:amino acid adenylation domain-containing protein